ncbi:MAG: PAS domain S-box protein [Fischerella sp. CENA71]|nr:PAS domain S-box protein [Fischerella sp. CENA71]
MLVDDCLEDQAIYRRYLLQDKQHTYNILQAQTGEEGLQLCQQQHPDVILLDYLLPDMDGLEFLTHLNTQLGQTNLPVIMLTGQGNEQIAVQAMKKGAADYLVKSHTTTVSLSLTIQNVLEKTSLAGQLEESEGLFRATFNQAAVGIAHVGLDGKWLLVNQKLCKIVGYTHEELNQLTFQDLTHPDDLNTDLEYIRLLLIGEIQTYSIEKRYIRKDKTLIWINLTVSPVRKPSGEPKYFICVVQDISDRKQIEQRLQAAHDQLERRVSERTAELEQAQAKLSHIINSAIAAIISFRVFANRDWEYEYFSTGCETIYGYTPQEFMADKHLWMSRVVPEDRETVILPLFEYFFAEGSTKIEFRFCHRDGSIRWIASTYTSRRDQVRDCWIITAVNTDISDRKQAEQKIREQAALLDVASDAIFVRDLQHNILFWNQGAERLYAWQSAEILGKKANEIFSEETLPQVESAMKILLDQGKWQGELEHTTKDGKKVIVQSRWTLVQDDTEQPKFILTVNSDITEKKQLEVQFYQAQRLESLGTLASGIAHDMNNILSPILTVAQLLPLKLPNLDDKNRQLLKVLEDNSKRGAELVKQILSFARGAEGKRVPLQIKHLIKELERIVKSTFPKSIEICTEVPQPLYTVLADPTQIHQVLMNLCVNARDAMSQGGTLTISAENFFVDENYARMNLEAKIGNYVMITVSDTGCGIPKELSERIFEPFFTTKEPGKGTGLGLSTVIGIIKNHDGFVNLYSQVGKGSRFKVFLPTSEQTATQEDEHSQKPKGNGELILIVDDEASIREITKTSLEDYNYTTLIARDGVEAFSLYAQHQNEIRLVLMDMQMPWIDGLNVIRVLQQMNPSVKVIAVSGLASNCQLLEANGINVGAFLLKPYTLEELLDTIKYVLER